MRKRNVPDLKPRPARHVTALTAMAMLAGTFGIQSCDDVFLTERRQFPYDIASD